MDYSRLGGIMNIINKIDMIINEADKKINDCIHCKNYKNQRCSAGHNYDNVIKASHNTGFDIQCDAIKVQYCKDNGIDLLVLNHKEWIKNKDWPMIDNFIVGHRGNN